MTGGGRSCNHESPGMNLATKGDQTPGASQGQWLAGRCLWEEDRAGSQQPPLSLPSHFPTLPCAGCSGSHHNPLSHPLMRLGERSSGLRLRTLAISRRKRGPEEDQYPTRESLGWGRAGPQDPWKGESPCFALSGRETCFLRPLACSFWSAISPCLLCLCL